MLMDVTILAWLLLRRREKEWPVQLRNAARFFMHCCMMPLKQLKNLTISKNNQKNQRTLNNSPVYPKRYFNLLKGDYKPNNPGLMSAWIPDLGVSPDREPLGT